MNIAWPKAPTSWIEQRIFYISIPFTWHLPQVKAHLMQQSFLWDSAVVGGPAVSLLPTFFEDCPHVTTKKQSPGVLQRINPYATRTTIGCPNNCKFCGVKRINGNFIELEDWPNLPIIIDDNLLAASEQHFDRVIDRLIQWNQWKWTDFNQGLDSRLLTDYHAKRLAQIQKSMIRLALDNMTYAETWETAFERLRRAGIAKTNIRSYALIAFNTDPGEAWCRCEWIESHGIKVLPMWHHPLDALRENTVTKEQRELGWTDYERRRIMQWFYQHKKAVRYERDRQTTDKLHSPGGGVAAEKFSGFSFAHGE